MKKQEFTIYDNYADYMKGAGKDSDPQTNERVRRFFEYNEKRAQYIAATGKQPPAPTDPAAVTFTENDFFKWLGYTPTAAPSDGQRDPAAVTIDATPPPMLLDETPAKMPNYITGILNPLIKMQYAKAGEIAQKSGLTRGLRTFANLNTQEIQAIEWIMERGRKNLKIQADRLRKGLPTLAQGGRFTFADVKRAFDYGKNADVNDKFAAAFDTLAREKFLFFDEINGVLLPLSILDGNINLKSKIKTYTISQQFLNTLPAIDTCLMYYNLSELTNGRTVADLFQYKGDKAILRACLRLVYERNVIKTPFLYSDLIARARGFGWEINKAANWKRAVKLAFNYLGWDVIDGDSDRARKRAANPEKFTPDRDKFIIERLTADIPEK